ncbi:MAG: glycerol-3-phosphate dehydrogenase, partial [Zoogloeaceae bacterium]|nr:glycerol-3-phosphate dehydrogenase [Zoogloeaceae bacterium]
MKITVLAAGAWGTALALAFAARHRVTLWAQEAELVADMQTQRENRRFLPGFVFPDALRIEGNLGEALTGTELILVATPIAGLRPTLQTLAALRVNTPLLWVCKGVEAGSGALPHQIAAHELPNAPQGVLTGPSFAQEVAGGQPTAIILAAADKAFAHK